MQVITKADRLANSSKEHSLKVIKKETTKTQKISSHINTKKMMDL
jgi:hypothetical protein